MKVVAVWGVGARAVARVGLSAAVALAVASGCAPASPASPASPGPADALCAQLDAGANATSLAAADPASTNDPVGVLTRGRDAIRARCPQHEQQAALLERVASQVGQPSSGDPAAGEGPDPTVDAPGAQAPRQLRYRVEGEGIKQAAVTWTAGGSSGGDSGSPVALPWTRTVTAAPQDNLVLTGTSASGASGELRCSITDTKTGEVLATKSATADGGDSAFASIACG